MKSVLRKADLEQVRSISAPDEPALNAVIHVAVRSGPSAGGMGILSPVTSRRIDL